MFLSTSSRPSSKEIEEARSLAERLGVPYIERGRDSLTVLFERAKRDQVVIVSRQGWRYEDRTGTHFFFHPNMSAIRVKHLLNGEPDSLIDCSDMQAGDEVLDCTLGMGADAIVSSFVVGETGRVVALESQSVIAALVGQGLQKYETERMALNQAMRRVEVVEADYRSYLAQLPDRSFDIVLFDPMFRSTVQASKAMQALKPIANPEPLDEHSVREAMRVARRAVLLKERVRSGEFERLGFQIVKASSNFAWGIIRREEGRHD